MNNTDQTYTLPKRHTDKSQKPIRILYRNKMLILSITILSFLITAFILQQIKPVYIATAQMVFDNKEKNFIQTQRIILGSPHIADAVLRDLAHIEGAQLQIKNPKFKTINPYKTQLATFSDDIISKELKPLIPAFRQNFTAELLPDSYILTLSYKSDNPKNAADILNKIMQHYLRTLTPEMPIILRNKPHETRARLKNDAEIAQKNVADFKDYIMQQSPISVSHIRMPHDALDLKYAEAKAKLQPFLDQKGTLRFNEDAPAIFNARSIQKLKLKRMVLKGDYQKLAMRYGRKHPKIIEITTQISATNKRIAQESIAVMKQVKSRYDALAVQHNALKASARTSPVPPHKAAQEKLNMLQDIAAEKQHLYNQYQIIYNAQFQNAKKRATRPAHILSQAHTSATPFFPQKAKILGSSAILACLFGVGLAFFIERMRNTFLSGQQLEASLNLPCYALIPYAQSKENEPLAHYVMDNPVSLVAESVRTMRMALKLRAISQKQEHQVITITSSFPGEGKTTLASWMAQLAAKAGERVILIDADFRRPRVHTSFGTKNKVSLVEYLGGQNTLDETIDTQASSGLHIIYGRAIPGSALDLLSSPKMEGLIQTLRQSYDLIIIDSPACMAVSDARALATYSDQLLYTVSWNKTPRDIIHSGIAQFLYFGNIQIATVLTNINLKKHIQFGYGAAVNYYEQYQAYTAR